MPNAMGHAKDFFLESTADGELNPYGHVAIISQVGDDFIEVIQQNAGPFGATRERYPLRVVNGRARVEHERVLGWLRRPPAPPAKADKDD